jgi:hypothetical protein
MQEPNTGTGQRTTRPTGTRRGRIAGLTCLAALAALTACSTGGTATPDPATPAPTTQASAPASSTPAATPAGASSTSGSGQEGLPRCTTAELSGSLVGGEGAAGTVYRSLVLTNTGSHNCELTGFPGVSFVAGDDGHQVGPAAEMRGDRGGAVSLPPGGAAAADLGMVQIANYDAAACQPTPVRGLGVYPPGDTASLFIDAAGTGCAGAPPGPQLTITTLSKR